MGSPPPTTMKVALTLLSLAAAATAYPMFLLEEEPLVYRVPRQMPQDRMPSLQLGGRRSDDLETAADAAYGAAPVGRVKIQVYRGPSKGDYDFAPWGYYNTQPADLAIHH